MRIAVDDNRLRLARAVIEHLDIDENHYRRADLNPCAAMVVSGEALANNRLLLRGEHPELSLTLRGTGRNNRIFVHDGVSGEITIGLEGDNGLIYLGRDVTLRGLHIGSRQHDDFIAVGNDVATTGPGRWVSGLRAGSARPALIVGDCCVISRDVVLRNSDGHPIFDPELRTQLNSPCASLLIEPHVWLGERCAVLKDVTIGAFSMVGFAAVVTRDVPRHHVAQGAPAVVRAMEQRLWTWDDTPAGLERARYWLQRYPQ